MKNLFFLFCLFISLAVSTGCGKDDPIVRNDCTSQGVSQTVQNAYAKLEVTISNYVDDPSTENCNAYKREARAYLELLRDFEDCPGIGDTQEWQESITEAQAELDMLQC